MNALMMASITSSNSFLPLDLTHVEIETPNYDGLRQERLQRNKVTMEVGTTMKRNCIQGLFVGFFTHN